MPGLGGDPVEPRANRVVSLDGERRSFVGDGGDVVAIPRDVVVNILGVDEQLSGRQTAEGQADAPWPPHYAKQEGEPPRAAPSRRRKG